MTGGRRGTRFARAVPQAFQVSSPSCWPRSMHRQRPGIRPSNTTRGDGQGGREGIARCSGSGEDRNVAPDYQARDKEGRQLPAPMTDNLNGSLSNRIAKVTIIASTRFRAKQLLWFRLMKARPALAPARRGRKPNDEFTSSCLGFSDSTPKLLATSHLHQTEVAMPAFRRREGELRPRPRRPGFLPAPTPSQHPFDVERLLSFATIARFARKLAGCSSSGLQRQCTDNNSLIARS